MLQYKAAWKGVTIIPLTKAETYGSSSKCASSGEMLHDPEKGDAQHRRALWCQRREVWVDRDVTAALNLSQRGRLRFDRSLLRLAGREQQVYLLAGEKGLAVEAVKGNGQTRVPILRVDASKSGLHLPNEDEAKPAATLKNRRPTPSPPCRGGTNTG